MSSESPWTSVEGIDGLAQARTRSLAEVRALVERGPLVALADRLEVLEESVLPPPDSESNDYLALHFDFGHPLFPTRPAPLYVGMALYRPPDAPSAGARTRLLALDELRRTPAWGDADHVEARLRSYVRTHGSSWDWEEDSGHRVSCFARILDALDPRGPRLTNFRATPREDWYEVSRAGHEFDHPDEEAAFYRSCGVPLDGEVRVQLAPGQLLVVDNVRAVHGRIGARVPGELVQFLIGVARCPAAIAARVRSWVVATLAGEARS